MNTQQSPRSEQYRRVRDEFDQLNVEDRAVFLLEGMVTTIAHGIEEVGRIVGDALENAFSQRPASETPPTETTTEEPGTTPPPDFP